VPIVTRYGPAAERVFAIVQGMACGTRCLWSNPVRRDGRGTGEFLHFADAK
jgi:hypothetical protein